MQNSPAIAGLLSSHDVKAVIFDLDGVLVLTDDFHLRSWTIAAGELSMGIDPSLYDSRLRGLGRVDAAQVILDAMGSKSSNELQTQLANRKQEIFLDLIAHQPPRVPVGAHELLGNLQRRGIKLAIASSSRNARLLLVRCELSGLLDYVVDGNDVPGKPDPATFLRAANGLKVSVNNCLIIEDARAGLEAARRAGISAIAIGPPQRFESGTRCVPDLRSLSTLLLGNAP